jgi:hypothetical protein
MGDRRPKDSGGMNHHYKTCKEIMSKESSKEIFLYTSLPPGESFKFIVREQDCLHTFED